MFIQCTLDEFKKYFKNVYKFIPKDVRDSNDDNYIVRYDPNNGCLELGYPTDNFYTVK
nr:MAG TPA: hypothetical protein [Inoviridae sp.]